LSSGQSGRLRAAGGEEKFALEAMMRSGAAPCSTHATSSGGPSNVMYCMIFGITSFGECPMAGDKLDTDKIVAALFTVEICAQREPVEPRAFMPVSGIP
jgi:hypothetical protein